MPQELLLRPAQAADFDAMWPIFQADAAAGNSYVFDAATPREEARACWFGPGIACWVAEEGGGSELLGK